MSETTDLTETVTPERDPHRCAWWPGCSNPDLRDKDNPQPAVIADGFICDGCYWRLHKTVQWLAKDWLRLRAAIGDRSTTSGQRVHQSRTPDIPLNVATEALMRRIVEAVDRAASTVESILGMTGANRSRSDSPPDGRTGRGYLAANGRRHTTPGDYPLLETSTQLLLGTLDVLVEAPPDEHLVWLPLPDQMPDRVDPRETAPHPDGAQPRAHVALSGLDLARELVTLGHHVGMQLGLSYLRTPSDVPCHRCGAETLGRDNGCWDIDCTTCGARYTEGEHGLLIRLLADEIQSKEEDHLLKFLLAEAYQRLDMLRKRAAILDDLTDDAIAKVIADGPDQTLELVKILRDATAQCAGVLDAFPDGQPHPTPAERQIGVREHERKTAAQQKKLQAAAIERDQAAAEQRNKTHRKRERSTKR